MTKKNIKSFTMIELIFILVIISIIAAVSIPKLTATKDDAIGVSLKNDISNTTTAVITSYNTLPKLDDISKAILLDAKRWIKKENTNKSDKLAYVYSTKENGRECVRMQINDANNSKVFQVLVVADGKDISGNDSSVCKKVRHMYLPNKDDGILGEFVDNSVYRYIKAVEVPLDSNGDGVVEVRYIFINGGFIGTYNDVLDYLSY